MAVKISIIRYLRAFFTNVREFGLSFALKCTLEFLGRKTFLTVRYPLTGIRVCVRTSDFWKKLERGQWELDAIRYVSSVLKEGQVVLDVGAWLGPYALLFSKLVQKTGQIYAFEPDPAALDVLRDNIAANHLTNIHIEEACLSNSSGKTRLKTCSKTRRFGGSGSSIISPLRKEVSREITVEATTVDEYCEGNNTSPHGIKVDVEGAEGMVIEGARRTIERCSPWVLLEFHGHLMPEEERLKCWQGIVAGAKKLIFIEGDSSRYHYGDEIISIPDCLKFHSFIQY